MRSSCGSCLFSAAIVLSLICVGTCYSCYFCMGLGSVSGKKNLRSEQETPLSCINVAEPNHLPRIACPGDCAKVVVTAKGTKLVLRDCKEHNQCLNRHSDCYYCKGDLCNSSSRAMPPAVVISAISLFVTKYFVLAFYSTT